MNAKVYNPWPLMGRMLLSTIFIMSGVNKIMSWSETIDHMESEAMAMVPLLLVGAIAFEVCGGLSVLLGCWARLGAAMLIIFLIPTTLIFHDFWAYEGPERQQQMINFMKNLSIMGGLFVVLGFGAGPLSIDGHTHESTTQNGPSAS